LAPIVALVAGDSPVPHWQLAAEPAAPTRPEAVPAPSSPAAAAPQAVVGQLAAAVAHSTDGQVEIRLDPPELGRVQIHLAQLDGGLEAVVLADRPETQDLLRRHADQLARELEAAGYARVSLDFAAGGETATRSYQDRPAAPFELQRPPDEEAKAARPMAPAGGLDVRL
jgi:flagellar hook-length control protein FliK